MPSDYQLRPIQPTVLKVDRVQGQIDYQIALQNGQDNYPGLTKMNVMRFIQDLWEAESIEPKIISEEVILTAFEKFFGRFTW